MKDVFGNDEDDSKSDKADTEDASSAIEPIRSSDIIPLAKRPRLGVVSEFNSQATFDSRLKKFLKECCDDLIAKIMRTSVDDMSSIEEKITKGISYIKDLKHDFDISRLESDITTLFSRAADYDQARSKSYEIDKGSANKVQETKVHLHTLHLKVKEDILNIRRIKDELSEIKKREDKLTMDLMEHQSLLDVNCMKIRDLEEKINKFKNAPPIDGEVLESLKNSKLLLEYAQEARKDQDPFV